MAIAVVSFGTTFAILRHKKVTKPYLYVGDHEVSALEYNYYYNSIYLSYVQTMGTALTYMDVDLEQDLLPQMHDEERTFEQYFTECTENLLRKDYALWDEGHKNGFSYDASADYETYLETIKSTSGYDNVDDYFESTYGVGANSKSMKKFFELDCYCAKYFEIIQDEKSNMFTNVDEATDYVWSLAKNYEITYP